MSEFNNNGEYLGFQDLEIRQIILDIINISTASNPAHTFDSIVNTPLGAIFIILYQLALQNETARKVLQTESARFLQNKFENKIIYKGGSIFGLETALGDLDVVEAVNISDKNKENTLTAGIVYPLVLLTEDTIENRTNVAIELAKYRANITDYIPSSTPANQVSIDVTSPNTGQPTNIKYTLGTKRAIKVKIFRRYNSNIDYSTQQLSDAKIAEIYMNNFNAKVKYGHIVYPSILNDINLFPSVGQLKTKFAIDGTNFDTDFDLIKTPSLTAGTNLYDLKELLYIADVADISVEAL